MRELTHVLNEGNVPFSSDPRTSSFAAEVRAGDYGRRPLGVVFHGSDARDPALAKEIDEASYFFDADPEWTRMVGERAARNRAEIAALGIPTFVTTPDMLAHVDGAELLPLSVDTHGWASGRPVMESAVPRVLHRGSGSKYTKGSKYILPALEALESAGRIELLTSPVLPHHAMAELIKSSDIVVDQVQTGTYGVTGVEAMAAGRLVVANISAHSGDVERPPIFHATPLGFTAAMEEILDSPDSARRVAERGPGYVDRVHNGQAAARVLRRFARET
ncbi:hypothetical protein CQ045_04565 [Microbacterium sp. MYb66]|nr:hypothetical protein CQ045_04565 [Microbacterium sp. MYb66]